MIMSQSHGIPKESPVHDRFIRSALYARVSSEQQAQAGTIESQVAAVVQRAEQDGVTIDSPSRYIDPGHSGATLIRPALERLRDAAAAGEIERLYVLCPDRLARNYAYQMLLVDELQRCGVELVFVNHKLGTTPEDNLLLQVQGVVAEYERAKIMERCRRGKLHGARAGRVSVLGSAPYGYRYTAGIAGAGGVAAAQYNPHLPEASVVREVFQWVGVERITLRHACRRLEKQGILSPSGMNRWNVSSLRCILTNPAYKGSAAYGKTFRGPMRQRMRPIRNSIGIPRGGKSLYPAPREQWIGIPVPAIVDEQLFDSAARQLAENGRRRRERRHGPAHLLQGLLVCKCCGYACYGTYSGPAGKAKYCYYRCTGTDPHRFGGRPVCRNKSVRQQVLDEAVWNDVRTLLADPARVERELHRRLEGDDADERQQQADQNLEAQIDRIRRGINRLIDAYEQEMLTKEEFEPRITSARRQLSQLQEQLQQRVDQAARGREMRLVIDNLETFSKQVASGLEEADWQTRREIICTLVKRIELDPKDLTIVYRVDIRPFDPSPTRGNLQYCTVRAITFHYIFPGQTPLAG
jgi:site-specific DNA recombinase